MIKLTRNLYRLHFFGLQGAVSLALMKPPLVLALLIPWFAGSAWNALKMVFLLDLFAYLCFGIPLFLLSRIPIGPKQMAEALDGA